MIHLSVFPQFWHTHALLLMWVRELDLGSPACMAGALSTYPSSQLQLFQETTGDTLTQGGLTHTCVADQPRVVKKQSFQSRTGSCCDFFSLVCATTAGKLAISQCAGCESDIQRSRRQIRCAQDHREICSSVLLCCCSGKSVFCAGEDLVCSCE